MDTMIERIKSYVRILDNSIADDEILDFVIQDVVDRALLYTNRYETKVLPQEIERPLAKVVLGVYKNARKLANSGEPEKEISSITSHGQSITYSQEVKDYLVSSDDKSIFSSITELLDKLRIPTIIENTRKLQKQY